MSWELWLPWEEKAVAEVEAAVLVYDSKNPLAHRRAVLQDLQSPLTQGGKGKSKRQPNRKKQQNIFHLPPLYNSSSVQDLDVHLVQIRWLV